MNIFFMDLSFIINAAISPKNNLEFTFYELLFKAKAILL